MSGDLVSVETAPVDDDWRPPKPDDPDDQVRWALDWLDEDEILELAFDADDPAFGDALWRRLGNESAAPAPLWWPPEATERFGVDLNPSGGDGTDGYGDLWLGSHHVWRDEAA